jgi:pilus assembly protein CpaB
MNKRFVGVLIFAFLVASGGGLITYRQLVNHAPAGKAAQPTARVVVAAHNMDAGKLLGADDVKLANWSGAIPAGASSNPTDFIGRGVIAQILSDEPVSDTRLAPKGGGAGLAAMIPAGKRAFAVRVNEVVGVSGFATPGMRVDVLINGAPPGGSEATGTLARTLLQDIEVLSAGQDFKKDAEGKPVLTQVVNLLVTPEQAEKLSLAANQTAIQLILRNPLDRLTAPTPGSSMAALFHGEAPKAAARKPAIRPVEPPPPPKKEPIFTMEIISGTQKTEKQFRASGEDK